MNDTSIFEAFALIYDDNVWSFTIPPFPMGLGVLDRGSYLAYLDE